MTRPMRTVTYAGHEFLIPSPATAPVAAAPACSAPDAPDVAAVRLRHEEPST